jgi:bifunctional non-homologous end joining protein LigD
MADFRMDSAHRLDRFKPAVLDFLHAAPQRFAEDRPTPIDLLQADFTPRFPRIVEAVSRLKVRSALIDGEGVVYNDKGMPSFNMIHSKQHDHAVSLVAFDLLQLDGEDVRRTDLLARKLKLKLLVAKAKDGLEYNDHLTGAGSEIFAHACRLGHEGIVAKRIDLPYESGRSKRWLKIKNPDSPAMQRVRDERF